MPQVNRSRKGGIRKEIRTVTSDGVITINLNLNISIEEDHSIKISATGGSPVEGQPRPPLPVDPIGSEERKSLDIVPTELFSAGDDLLEGFGD